MKKVFVMCEKCAGMGYTNQRLVPCGNSDTVGMEQDICKECNGTGYTEYAVFSIEEAKAILKYCGLTTES